MKILVTGCAGFIGSHITDALLAKGHKVVGIDTARNDYIIGLEANPNFKFYHRSVQLNLSEVLDGVTHICHQAAYGSVPRSIENPLGFTENNIMGFANVLEGAREAGIKRVVFASSSSVYEMLSPYAMTKDTNETQARQYASIYGLETIGLRYFNVYGPRQRADSPYSAVISKWVKAIQNGEPIYINGNGHQSRDFTYVKDVVEANLLALFGELKNFGRTYDIGCGSSTTLNFLAQKLGYVLGIKPQIYYNPERQGDAFYSKASTWEAEEALDFTAEYPLERGLTDWLKASS